MNTREALKLTAQMLTPFTDEPLSEAKHIVAHLANCEPNNLVLSSKEIDLEDIKAIAAKRRDGIPLQYILGKWWFYKSEFLVGEGVLIPRQDTETLVETALEFIKDIKNPKICDLCSGSGCIAISIANDRKDAAVTAVEKYDGAYEFLLKNIEYNRAENITPLKADATAEPIGEYNLIVCNPPYIKDGDKNDLSLEVLNEPHTALFGGEDGLYFYRVISEKWKSALKANGILAFEVGINEAEEVAKILKNNGFKNIGVKKDLIGIERVVFGTVSSL